MLAYSTLSSCRVLRPLFLALTASSYLFSVGPVVLCGTKSSVITPTFHRRKHKPRCAKGLSDLVYQPLGDRVELASELSDLQFIRIKLKSNVRGEMLPVGILTSVERGEFLPSSQVLPLQEIFWAFMTMSELITKGTRGLITFPSSWILDGTHNTSGPRFHKLAYKGTFSLPVPTFQKRQDMQMHLENMPVF